jgi:hypothetical protein
VTTSCFLTKILYVFFNSPTRNFLLRPPNLRWLHHFTNVCWTGKLFSWVIPISQARKPGLTCLSSYHHSRALKQRISWLNVNTSDAYSEDDSKTEMSYEHGSDCQHVRSHGYLKFMNNSDSGHKRLTTSYNFSYCKPH